METKIIITVYGLLKDPDFQRAQQYAEVYIHTYIYKYIYYVCIYIYIYRVYVRREVGCYFDRLLDR